MSAPPLECLSGLLRPPSPSHSGGCFICLESATRNRHLVSCCTQCYTKVHLRCWAKWRRNQKLAALRARLLGQPLPNSNSCSVCRSGEARVPEEQIDEDPTGVERSLLQDELLTIVARMLLDNEDDEDAWPPLCSKGFMAAGAVLFLLLVLVILVAIIQYEFYPGDVLLWSMLAGYLMLCALLLLASVFQRRESLGVLVERLVPASRVSEVQDNV